MDLTETLQHLRSEKDRLQQAIALLEELQAGHTLKGLPSATRRGRKSMNAKEREEVSQRMQRYWANWRKKRGRVREKV
jgi:hypothetical protein